MSDAYAPPQQEMTLGQQLQEHIALTDKQIKYCEISERKAAPPAIQEMVLARRHLEDANSRFKKAYNLLEDKDK
jgi:hypothetical protein